MINLSKNVPYIVAFPQGASGRFVKYLLHNLLTNSDIKMFPCPVTNSTHDTDNQLYCGYPSIFDNSSPGIWEIFDFDPVTDPINGSPRVFPTHQFPDFKRIKERLGPDVKIVIITVDPFDLPEVIINDKVKNTYDLFKGTSKDPIESTIKMYSSRCNRFLGRPYTGNFVLDDAIQVGKSMALDSLPYFINKAAGKPIPSRFFDFEERLSNFIFTPKNIDYPEDQLLLLPYSDLYTEWRWMHKLEKFTNRKANAITDASYQRYLTGRKSLVEKYRL